MKRREDFRFTAVKLLDYRDRLAELAASRNPFATVVLAHLAALATRRDAERRGRSKVALVRRLYDLGYDGPAIRSLYRLIDWLLLLPAELETRVWRAVRAIEEERQVTFITYAERVGMEKGRAEGLEQGRAEGLRLGLAVALEATFGAEGRALAPALDGVAEAARLEAIAERLRAGATLAELRAAIETPPA